MQEELEKLKPELKNAAEVNNQMVQVIEAESVEIAKKGEKVRAEEEIANRQVRWLLQAFNPPFFIRPH